MSDEADTAKAAARRDFWENLWTVLLSILTGLGHLYRRSYFKGALLMSAFLLSANGWFLGSVLLSKPNLTSWLLWACPFLTATIWLAGIIDAYRISFRRDRPRLRRRRRELLQRGLKSYLANKLEDARRALCRAVRYDYDWEDAHLLFHLGVVELRLASQLQAQGDQRGAKRKQKEGRQAFLQYLSREPKGQWRDDIKYELQQQNLKLPRGLS